MERKFEQKGFKTKEELVAAVEAVSERTTNAWIFIPSDFIFYGFVYATPYNELNILQEMRTDGKSICFNIKENPKEICFFWVE